MRCVPLFGTSGYMSHILTDTTYIHYLQTGIIIMIVMRSYLLISFSLDIKCIIHTSMPLTVACRHRSIYLDDLFFQLKQIVKSIFLLLL